MFLRLGNPYCRRKTHQLLDIWRR